MDTVIRARFRNKKEVGLVDKIIGWALRLGIFDAVKVVRVVQAFGHDTDPLAVRLTKDGRVELWANLGSNGISWGEVKRFIFSDSTRETVHQLRAGRRCKDRGKAWVWAAKNKTGSLLQTTSRRLRMVIKRTHAWITNHTTGMSNEFAQWAREVAESHAEYFRDLHKQTRPNGMARQGIADAFANSALWVV